MKRFVSFLILSFSICYSIKSQVIVSTLGTGDGLLIEEVGNCPMSINMFLNQRAIGFITPDNEIEVESVVLTLENANTGGSPIVTIKADNSMLDQPGSILATFVNPTLDDARGDYMFTLTTPLSLSPQTRYWLDVDHSDNSNCFLWISGSSLSPSLPSGAATISGNHRSTDDGLTYGNTGPFPLFQINGTIIPNPIPTLSQWGLILLGLLISILGVRYLFSHNRYELNQHL